MNIDRGTGGDGSLTIMFALHIHSLEAAMAGHSWIIKISGKKEI